MSVINRVLRELPAGDLSLQQVPGAQAVPKEKPARRYIGVAALAMLVLGAFAVWRWQATAVNTAAPAASGAAHAPARTSADTAEKLAVATAQPVPVPETAETVETAVPAVAVETAATVETKAVLSDEPVATATAVPTRTAAAEVAPAQERKRPQPPVVDAHDSPAVESPRAAVVDKVRDDPAQVTLSDGTRVLQHALAGETGAEAALLVHLQQHPAETDLRKQWAQHLIRLQRFADAKNLLLAALPPLQQDRDLHALMAVAELHSGAPDAAAARYRQLLTLAPDHGAWWAGLAMSLDATGAAGAREAWAAALNDPRLDASLRQWGTQRLAALNRP